MAELADTATRDGERHHFIALVGRYTERGTYYLSSFQAPEAIYAAWGRPTFFVQVAGKIIQEVVTPELIASVTVTTPEQDIQIADMIITQSINVLFVPMTFTMGNISSMQGLSAGIATRTECILTTGCVPGRDNQ